MLNRVVRRLPVPADRPRRWSGLEGAEALEPLRMVRFGDCSWRETDLAHQTGLRPGFPLVLAERLAERGVGLRFTDVYVPSVAALPRDAEGLARFLRFEGVPDVVLLQPALAHATRALLPSTPALNRLRRFGAWRAGRLAGPGYATLHPLLRRFGRHVSPYEGGEHVSAFLDAVSAVWPSARVIALSPPVRPARDGWADPAELERVWNDVAAVCAARGVEVVDTRDELDALVARMGPRAVYAANACDLRRVGHEAVAGRLLEALGFGG